MPKKNKKAKPIDFGQIEETRAASEHLTESAAPGNEAISPDPNPVTNEDASVHEEMVSGEESQEQAKDAISEESDDVSADDLLDDVRRSLIEDETHIEEEKQSKWWKRISKGSKGSKSSKDSKGGKGSRKAQIDTTDVVKDEPIKEPADKALAPVVERIEPTITRQETEPDPIDELIEMLEHDAGHDIEKVKAAEAATVEEVAPEPEQVIDVEELKKHAFSHREEENAADLREVRAIALGGDEEVFVEVDATRQDPGEERLKAFENALRPYRTYIYLIMAFLGIVMAGIASILLFNLYKASLPAKPAEEISNLPYPTAVSLPGGWSFALGKGSLVDGQWNPRGAEWLVGTEVCRWVALPWSRQLEAVVRTLNSKDKIELVMSNQDRLAYEVDSIHQMSPEEMQQLDSNSPCLLIVLAEPDAEKRWVLTALP